jgi:hypothetical protein
VKTGSSITTIIVTELHSHVPHILRVIAQDSNNASNVRYPFATALCDWSSDLIGSIIARLSPALENGESDAMLVLCTLMQQVCLCSMLHVCHESSIFDLLLLFGLLFGLLLLLLCTYVAFGGAGTAI